MAVLPNLGTARTRTIITGLLLASIAIGLIIGVAPLTRDAALIAFFLNAAILVVTLVLILVERTRTR